MGDRQQVDAPPWPLVTFLRARLDEDERDLAALDDVVSGRYWGNALDHARETILGQRRIIDEYEDRGWLECGPECGDLADVLRILAATYHDHPDYDQEWKP